MTTLAEQLERLAERVRMSGNLNEYISAMTEIKRVMMANVETIIAALRAGEAEQ